MKVKPNIQIYWQESDLLIKLIKHGDLSILVNSQLKIGVILERVRL